MRRDEGEERKDYTLELDEGRINDVVRISDFERKLPFSILDYPRVCFEGQATREVLSTTDEYRERTEKKRETHYTFRLILKRRRER